MEGRRGPDSILSSYEDAIGTYELVRLLGNENCLRELQVYNLDDRRGQSAGQVNAQRKTMLELLGQAQRSRLPIESSTRIPSYC